MVVILGFIIFIVIPALYIYSFFKPAKFNVRTNSNPSGKYSRLQFTGIAFGIWILLTVISSLFVDTDSVESSSDAIKSKSSFDETEIPKVEDKNKQKNTSSINETKKIDSSETVNKAELSPTANKLKSDQLNDKQIVEESPRTFGMTPDEYGSRFIAEVKKVGLGDYKWGGVNLNEGAVNDTFSVQLSDAIALTGVVDKNGELKGITYIMGRTDEAEKEVVNLLMMAGITARTLSPDLPKEQTAGVLVKLTEEAMTKFSEEGDASVDKVVGGIKYNVTASKVIGLWITFTPAE